jgi:hypothetical protein
MRKTGIEFRGSNKAIVVGFIVAGTRPVTHYFYRHLQQTLKDIFFGKYNEELCLDLLDGVISRALPGFDEGECFCVIWVR